MNILNLKLAQVQHFENHKKSLIKGFWKIFFSRLEGWNLFLIVGFCEDKTMIV